MQEALERKDNELRACKEKAEEDRDEAERRYVSTASELEALYERKLAKEGEQFEDLKAEYERVLVRVPAPQLDLRTVCDGSLAGGVGPPRGGGGGRGAEAGA